MQILSSRHSLAWIHKTTSRPYTGKSWFKKPHFFSFLKSNDFYLGENMGDWKKSLLLVNLQFEIFLKSRFYCTTYPSIHTSWNHFLNLLNSKVAANTKITNHSMAKANLNKSVWLVTNTTAASKYIPWGLESASIEIPPLRHFLWSEFSKKFQITPKFFCTTIHKKLNKSCSLEKRCSWKFFLLV